MVLKFNIKRSVFIYMIISVLTVLYFMIAIQQKTFPRIDAWSSPFAASISSDVFYYSIFHFFTFLGSRTFLIPVCLLISIPLYFMYRTMIPFIVVSGGTLATYGLNSFIKWIVGRERPQIVPELHAEGFSFPSGHAMISFVFYSLLMYFLLKYFSNRFVRFCIWLGGISFILLIGSSRYILYVHYMSDIIAGYILGSILLYTIIHFYEKYRNK